MKFNVPSLGKSINISYIDSEQHSEPLLLNRSRNGAILLEGEADSVLRMQERSEVGTERTNRSNQRNKRKENLRRASRSSECTLCNELREDIVCLDTVRIGEFCHEETEKKLVHRYSMSLLSC